MKPWRRYRFKTRAVADYRPLIFNPAYPWWCSGEAGDGAHVIIVAYLPAEANLLDYWDDAFEVEFTEAEAIQFSSRFPKPEYFQKVQP